MATLAVGTVVLLALGYTLYGRFISRQYALNAGATTPAVAKADGIDFVPTRPFYLMGQHFSAIAAAGPIAGPIMACLTFGWLPCLLWILIGSIFIGAVHDFSSLIASVRHGASSIAEVMRAHMGKGAWMAMLGFIWLALIYVLVAFADITANTFVGKTEELTGEFSFNPGGAVAAASVMYLSLAIAMGLVQRYWPKIPLWLLTIVFVPATLAAVWGGTQFSTWLVFSGKTWGLMILVYCCIAALMPVWLLLQPRGYLGGFVLYLSLAVGVVGLLFGDLPVAQPAFRAFSGPKITDALFPFLFVTIACGACSGFHGLVCSGTTSKQIAKETHCHPVGYGAMLLEAFVALIALGTVMFVADGDVAGRGPGRIYGDGLGRFMAVMIGDEHRVFAATFGAMAFSTFVFDTIDVATRLGRYILQELLGLRGWFGAIAGTLASVAIPAFLMVTAADPAPGQKPTYMQFWTLFGTANQLLAALTMLGVAVWLKRSGKRTWFVVVPMVAIFGVTCTSLVLQMMSGLALPWAFDTRLFNGLVALVLMVLTAFFGVAGPGCVQGGAAGTATHLNKSGGTSNPRPAPADNLWQTLDCEDDMGQFPDVTVSCQTPKPWNCSAEPAGNAKFCNDAPEILQVDIASGGERTVVHLPSITDDLLSTGSISYLISATGSEVKYGRRYLRGLYTSNDVVPSRPVDRADVAFLVERCQQQQPADSTAYARLGELVRKLNAK